MSKKKTNTTQSTSFHLNEQCQLCKYLKSVTHPYQSCNLRDKANEGTSSYRHLHVLPGSGLKIAPITRQMEKIIDSVDFCLIKCTVAAIVRSLKPATIYVFVHLGAAQQSVNTKLILSPNRYDIAKVLELEFLVAVVFQAS